MDSSSKQSGNGNVSEQNIFEANSEKDSPVNLAAVENTIEAVHSMKKPERKPNVVRTVEERLNACIYFFELQEKGVAFPHKKTADQFNCSPNNVRRWVNNYELLSEKASEPGFDSKRSKQIQNKKKGCFPALEQKLYELFLERRKAGLSVNGHWISYTAKSIAASEEFNQNLSDRAKNLKFSKKWVHNFCRRKKIARRRISNKKMESIEDRLPQIRHFHKLLMNLRGNGDEGKYGKYPPSATFNMDEVGLELEYETGYTYALKGAERVHVKQDARLSKRFCTIIVTCRGEGLQPRLGVIFRGKGIRIKKEMAEYDPRVDVFWSTKAFMNRRIMVEWAETTLSPFIREHSIENSLLLVDGFSSHKCAEVISMYKSRNVTCVISPPNCTDNIQAVDNGAGAELKRQRKVAMEEWLLDNKMSSIDIKDLNPSDLRIMTTHTLASAWDRMQKHGPEALVVLQEKYMHHTGSNICADGSNIDAIKLEGYNGSYTLDGVIAEDGDKKNGYLLEPSIVDQTQDETIGDDTFVTTMDEIEDSNEIENSDLDSSNSESEESDDDSGEFNDEGIISHRSRLRNDETLLGIVRSMLPAGYDLEMECPSEKEISRVGTEIFHYFHHPEGFRKGFIKSGNMGKKDQSEGFTHNVKYGRQIFAQRLTKDQYLNFDTEEGAFVVIRKTQSKSNSKKRKRS